MAEELKTKKQISTARACRIIGLERSGYYYQSVKDDTPVESRLLYYAAKLPARGCPEYTKRIRKEGYAWNHKRIERIYRKLGLNKRRRKIKRRIPNPEKEYLLQPIAPNITWSMDFMSDVLVNGRKIRVFNVIDDYNREALMCEIDYSIPSEKVVQLVEQLIEWHGKPSNIRTDNGFHTCCLHLAAEGQGIFIGGFRPALNGHKANIPSILLKAGDVVAVTDKSRQNEKLKAVVEANSAHPVPSWIDFDAEKLTAKINQLPNREDIDLDVEEHLIVELYSK